MESTLESRTAHGIANVAMPLLAEAAGRLRASLHRIAASRPDRIDSERMVEAATNSLRGRAAALMMRTLLVELHVARLEDRLRGDTAEARFDDFILQMTGADGRAALFAEYPLLAARVVALGDQWAAVWTEAVARLMDDWDRLEAELNDGAPLGQLVDLTAGAGDSHNHGRSVMIARFSTGVRVVYKPRGLGIDQHFQAMLHWLAERGLDPALTAIRLIDRGGHGWVEFVRREDCEDEEQVQRFHHRLGALVALVYCLAGSDIHAENLIARGEHPVLIDLEALFHPQAGTPADPDSAHGRMWNTVLGSLLLPNVINDGTKEAGADLSGIAGGGQVVRDAIILDRPGTDEMRLTRGAKAMEAAHNRCQLRGEPVESWRYTDDLVRGFTAMYDAIRTHAEEFIAGPLEAMRNAEIRLIPRPTQEYADILAESCHPDYLRRPEDRAKPFEVLREDVEAAPWLARLIPAEIEALERGDIPMFVTRPDAAAVRPVPGDWIEGVIHEPSFDLVTRRVRGLNDEDLRLQQWLIRASMATSVPKGAWTPAVRPVVETHSAPDPLAAAVAVGDRLLRLAIRGKDDVNWFGLSQADTHYWTVSPLLVDLYDGVPGVALFLADLGAVSGEERFTAVARRAAAGVVSDLDRYADYITDLGGFSGIGGLVYVLARLGELWNDRGLIDRAAALAATCVEAAAADEQFDIIAGAAGCAAAILALRRRGGPLSILDAAAACGDRLLAAGQPAGGGIGWPTVNGRMLSGFSHGSAGIAWTLLKLAGATGESRYRAAAGQAIAHERSLYDASARNWLDKRGDDGGSCTVWCHGAPGIGLARLDTIGLLDDGHVRAEVEVAVATTIAKGFGASDCLCHGTAGNLELLLRARAMDRSGEVDAAVRRESAGLIRRAFDGTCRMGTPLEVESPGLMTGLAGVGHGLLRLSSPDRVPSVLLLE